MKYTFHNVVRKPFSRKCRSVSSNNNSFIGYINRLSKKSFIYIQNSLNMVFFIFVGFCVYNISRTVITLAVETVVCVLSCSLLI